MTSSDELEVRGRRVRLTTLDRVYFPATGTTKSELLGYYIRVADVILLTCASACCTCTATPRA
jgi:bifunctional non-homologous end joining protein LigD